MIDPKVTEVTGKNASLNINEGTSASATMGKGKGKSIGRGRGGGGVGVSKYGIKRRGRGMGIDQICEGRNTLRPNDYFSQVANYLWVYKNSRIG